jgi:hypothetical protein
MSAGYRPLGCLLLLPLLLSAGAGCSSGFRVYPADKAPKGQSYLYYALPRAVVVVTIPVTRVERSAGECSVDRLADEIAMTAPDALAAPAAGAGPAPRRGAAGGNPREEAAAAPRPAPDASAAKQRALAVLKAAGIEPFDPKDAFDFTIGSVSLAARSEPDPDQVYAIALHSGFLSSTSYAFEFSDQGVLGTATRSSQSLFADYASKTITAITAASAAMPGFGGAALSNPAGPCHRALQELDSLRSARRALVEGKASTQGLSKEALEVLLGELSVIERDYIGRFAGKPTSVEGAIVCDYTPGGATTDKPAPLFTFTSRGVTGSAPECAVPADLRDPSASPAAGAGAGSAGGAVSGATDAVVLTIRRAAAIAEKVQGPETIAGEKGRGVYYRIPGQGYVTVARAVRGEGQAAGLSPLAGGRFDIPQFGRVMSLPGEADPGDASRSYTVMLDPVTGAILRYAPPSEGEPPPPPPTPPKP